jgi:lysophospholipase L1-like esterase
MWMRRSALVALFVLAAAGGRAADPAIAPSSETFFFKDGDTIVMIGDSITEQHLYSNYVEMWTVSRFPTWKLVFRNVGIGGDTSPGGNARFKRDVLAYKPTALTVDFGMNDGGYGAFMEGRFQNYLRGLQGMADQARKANIRVAWITPQPTERRESGPQLTAYNATLERFSAGVKEIAQKNGGLFVDQFHPYLNLMDKARGQDPKSVIMGGDAVHPGPSGQSVMAWGILKGLRFPRLVSSADMTLEAGSHGKGSGTAVQNCSVSEVTFKQDGGAFHYVSFQRKDKALPFFPEQARSILKWAPVLEDLNEYSLRVRPLKPGRYEVRLGGKTVATYSAEELAKGVNLAGPALTAGPVADQVKAVWKAVQDKNRYFHDRIFRGVVLAGVQVPDWLDVKLTSAEIETRRREALAKRLERMPELDEAVRQALVPRSHRVEIAWASK